MIMLMMMMMLMMIIIIIIIIIIIVIIIAENMLAFWAQPESFIRSYTPKVTTVT